MEDHPNTRSPPTRTGHSAQAMMGQWRHQSTATPVLLLIHPQGLEAAECAGERPLIIVGQVPDGLKGGGGLALETLELGEVLGHAAVAAAAVAAAACPSTPCASAGACDHAVEVEAASSGEGWPAVQQARTCPCWLRDPC